MGITVKRMETVEETRGRAYVHWRTWHETYPGLISREALDRHTLERCEEMAFRWPDDTLVAKDGDGVVGFLCCGDRGEEAPDTGEIFALYVLPEYWGKGVGLRLMEEGLRRLERYPQVCLWVLKENARAIRFYEECGFRPDGAETTSSRVSAEEIRMTLNRENPADLSMGGRT